MSSTSEILVKEKSCIFESRLADASLCQKAGTEKYREKEVEAAIELYKRGLYHVDFDEASWSFELLDQHREAVQKVRLPIYLNLAACYLSTLPEESLKYAKEALEIDAKHPKALYRAGMASLSLKSYEEAQRHLKKAISLQPNDNLIRKALDQLKQHQKDYRKEEKEIWKNAFSHHQKPSDISNPSLMSRPLLISVLLAFLAIGLTALSKFNE